jgi:sugar lactone lactonase YvrE
MAAFAPIFPRRSTVALGTGLFLMSAAISCSSPSGSGATTAGSNTDSAGTAQSGAPANSPLQVVAEFREPQIVGVAVAPDGRVFGVFPRWDNNPVAPVALIGTDNSVQPYPDAGWNTWNDSVRNEPQKHWICPQSVHVDQTGMLWVLDPAAPGLAATVPGGPKLVKIDPSTNKVVQNISFPASVAPRKSYLNDVRIDTQRNVAYITDSGMGAIVVVDLKNGTSRRLLADHPSVHPEPGLTLKVDGHPMVDPKGKPMALHADGIALSRDNNYLYWAPLTSHTLYRIKTEALRSTALSPAQLGQQVENMGKIPATDGMEIDAKNNVYLTSFENNALVRRTPDGKIQTIVTESRLQWPDTYAITSKDELFVTTSAIHKVPTWNKGVGKQDQPYRILNMALPQ